jgi:hypothetical protein
MQTNNRLRTNTVRVVECIARNLGRICPENGFVTDGVVVDLDGDTRVSEGDKAQAFRKSGAIIRVHVGDWKLLHGTTKAGERGIIGGKRKRQIIEFICKQTLGKEQVDKGVKTYQIADWLRADIEWGVIYGDLGLRTAANELSKIQPDWGLPPSYINPLLTHGVSGPPLKFPHSVQVLRLQYDYDELFPEGAVGLPGHQHG